MGFFPTPTKKTHESPLQIVPIVSADGFPLWGMGRGRMTTFFDSKLDPFRVNHFPEPDLTRPEQGFFLRLFTASRHGAFPGVTFFPPGFRRSFPLWSKTGPFFPCKETILCFFCHRTFLRPSLERERDGISPLSEIKVFWKKKTFFLCVGMKKERKVVSPPFSPLFFWNVTRIFLRAPWVKNSGQVRCVLSGWLATFFFSSNRSSLPQGPKKLFF